MPSFFNSGVAASTTEPMLLVSPTTASLTFIGSSPFKIQETLAKKLLNLRREYLARDRDDNYIIYTYRPSYIEHMFYISMDGHIFLVLKLKRHRKNTKCIF